MSFQKHASHAGLAATVLVAAGLLVGSAGAVLAIGDGGSTPTCSSGKVWDESKKMCVDKRSGMLPDEKLADYAYAEAREGRYADALATLDLLANPNTPAALNYRGYATRKLGRVEEGIGYYLKSVALDANYTLVREYLGEAYLSIGKVGLAKDQLAEIGKRCTSCEPYQLLSQAIAQAS